MGPCPLQLPGRGCSEVPEQLQEGSRPVAACPGGMAREGERRSLSDASNPPK